MREQEPSPGDAKLGRGPGRALDIVRVDSGRSTDVAFQHFRALSRDAYVRGIAMALDPPTETRVERHEVLGRALVGVRDDALLDRGVTDPEEVVLVVSQTRHRMIRHGAGQLVVAPFAQPRCARLAVAKRLQGVIGRQRLVDVMQERRCLDKRQVDRVPARVDGSRQERGDLGDGGAVHR